MLATKKRISALLANPIRKRVSPQTSASSFDNFEKGRAALDLQVGNHWVLGPWNFESQFLSLPLALDSPLNIIPYGFILQTKPVSY